MKVIRKYIVEKADGTWVPHKVNRFHPITPDRFGRVSIDGESYFINGKYTHPVEPYAVLPPLPWPKAEERVQLLAEGFPSSVPNIRDFGQVEKMQEVVGFTSRQLELYAKSKKAATFLRSASDWIMFIAGAGIGGMIAAIAMYALSKWQG